MDFDNSAQVDELAKLPPEPPKPAKKWNGWSAPLRAVAAGVAETGAAIAESVKGAAQVEAAAGVYSSRGMFGSPTPQEQAESARQRAQIAREGVDTSSGVGTSLRNVARDYRPDPATAGLAENLVFELGRVMTKAIPAAVVGGPVVGGVLLGTDEGMKTADDLGRAGVDKDTRMAAGAIAGVAAGTGVALPAAGKTIAGTVGLVLAGGPASFMAQQAATRALLERADYGEIAKQFDPLDPVGLTVSTLLPAGFGAWALRSAAHAKGAAPKPTPDPAKPAADAPPPLTPEQVDAVMAHNLTLRQDVADATPAADAIAAVRPPEAAAAPAARVDTPPPVDAAPAPRAPDAPAPVAAPARADAPAAQAPAQKLVEFPPDPEFKALADSHKAAAARAAEVEATAPDLVVRQDADGKPVTAADELARIRREAFEGTDDTLGAQDADLLQVAAECALSIGAA